MVSRPRYRVGTASWTDPTLLQSGYYPPEVHTAEQRLRYYAAHFDTVEVDATYYALPSERTSVLWAERTPAAFTFHIKAFAWLTQHAAETRALPAAIRAVLPADAAGEERIRTPPPEALDLAFTMFHAALQPMRDTGKLGCVLLQFPPWFTATPTNEQYIDRCVESLPGDRLAVEFRHASWFDGRTERTLHFLTERGLVLVVLDAPVAPSIPQPPPTATGPVAYVRLHGRNRQAWFGRAKSAAERFKYRYSDGELHEVAERLRAMRDPRGHTPGTVYVLFNNCYADYGVRNAETLQRLLGSGVA